MASQANVIKSYLIGLGFDVDPSEFRQFENALGDAKSMVSNSTAAIGLDLIKWQAGILSLFASVSGAIIGTVDKVAMADQEYRLFGERMFMNTRQAREYKMALDALGQPIEAVAWDPELHERFKQLIDDQKRMETMLPGTFEEQMKSIRDVRFEFTRMGVELQGLAMIFTSTLFTKLGGSGDILTDLRKVNEWLLTHLPMLADELTDQAIPILKDTWGMLKDVGDMLGVAGGAFTNFVGIIAGDESLQGTTTDFHQFATAVKDVVHWLAELFGIMVDVEKVFLHLGVAAGDGLRALGYQITGNDKKAEAYTQREREQIFKAFEADADMLDTMSGKKTYDHSNTPAFMAGPGKAAAQAVGGGLGESADQFRDLAKRVSAATGIDADLIFAQWAHETGKFTNRGARELHNLGGIRKPGTTTYENFGSWEEYAAADARLLMSKRYAGLKDAHDADSYAAIMKRGGYYEGPLADYQRQMRSFQPAYNGRGGGSGTTVTIGAIHIMQPSATAAQIGSEVASKVHAKIGMQTQRNLVEADGVFG